MIIDILTVVVLILAVLGGFLLLVIAIGSTFRARKK